VVYHYLAVVFNQSDDNLLTIAPPHNAWIRCEFVEWIVTMTRCRIQMKNVFDDPILEVDEGENKIQEFFPVIYVADNSVPIKGTVLQIRFSCPRWPDDFKTPVICRWIQHRFWPTA
jgi:hypothetical protein